MTAGLLERTRAQLDDPEKRTVVGEALKFGVVGVGGVVVDFVLSNLFRHLGINSFVSKALSTTIAATLSYFANRHWSFAHRMRTTMSRELPMFIVLSAIGLGIAELCLLVSEKGLGYHSTLAYNVSANGFGLVLGTLWRFWSFKRWVFTAATPDDEVLASAAV